jgi:hypothetical protein
MAYSNTTGLPSSTETLSPYINAQWFTEESRTRGTTVHNACAADLNGLWIPPLPTAYQGYFESYKKWSSMMIEKVVVVEERFIDKINGYCGQPDLISLLKGDSFFSLIDWKTSIAAAKSWPLQLASYKHLANINGYPIKRLISVRLRENGSMPLVNEYTNGNDFNMFLAGLQLYKYFK